VNGARDRRLRALSGLLRESALPSQEEATARLRALGFAATQATVSRDLDRLGAVKVKRDGRLAYALPDQIAGADYSADRLERIVAEWALSAEAAGQIVVVRTPPGSAHVVASAIDGAQLSQAAGTVSGDDTLFVAARSEEDARALARRLAAMMGRPA